MQDSTFLVIGGPLGSAEPNTAAARWYVRNPPEFLRTELLTDYGSSVMPPKDASYTGFHKPHLRVMARFIRSRRSCLHED